MISGNLVLPFRTACHSNHKTKQNNPHEKLDFSAGRAFEQPDKPKNTDLTLDTNTETLFEK